MLTELRIENFAIIHRLELEFKPGLLTFTGETGAGKSIILDAIEALLGGRADASAIRSGAERAIIEGTFRLSGPARGPILEILEREDLLEDSPDLLTLERDLRREGRSAARINGRSANLSLLKEVGAYLVDIHGQSEHLSLLNVRSHLGLLDRFAGMEEPLGAYARDYRQLQEVRKELSQVRQAEQDSARRTDMLNYQIQEIEAAHLRPEEEEELRQDRTRLANAESLASLAQAALAALDEGTPETPAATDLLGQAAHALSSLARIDASRAPMEEQSEGLLESLSELSRELRDYLEHIEFNPRRLEQVEERLDLINTLKRKYGNAIEAVLAYAEEAHKQLDAIAHAGERIAELEEAEQALLQKLSGAAQALSQKRHAAAERLAKSIEVELDDLSMAEARFAVDFQTRPDPQGLPLPDGRRLAFDGSGFDRIEFLVAPNPGEGLKPLVKIASGGETSRLMLALKNILARADTIPTLIFDEIDQGIGGRIGLVIGEKLWSLAREHQVLCVTHLPQLAAFGDQHFKVTKEVSEGRTLTHVAPLSGQTRREELALMLGGVSQANLASAGEILEAAGERMKVKG